MFSMGAQNSRKGSKPYFLAKAKDFPWNYIQEDKLDILWFQQMLQVQRAAQHFFYLSI